MSSPFHDAKRVQNKSSVMAEKLQNCVCVYSASLRRRDVLEGIQCLPAYWPSSLLFGPRSNKVVRFGWNFACANICTNRENSQNFWGSTRLFLNGVQKASKIRAPNLWNVEEPCRYWNLAHAKFQPNRTTLLLLGPNQREVGENRGRHCTTVNPVSEN